MKKFSKFGRVVHKEIHDNEQLAELDINCRYLYVSLIIHSDDYGRMKASPKSLKALIFPFDEAIRICSIKDWRDKLAATGLIQVYAADGQEYLVHPNWEKWQPLRSDRLTDSNCPVPTNVRQMSDKCPPNTIQHNITQPIQTKPIQTNTKQTKQLVPTEPNVYFAFLESFGKTYQERTGNPFNRQGKHFALVKTLIDKHGVEEVNKKTFILEAYCKEAEKWFVKDGFADFTIEKLSSQWNSLLAQVKISKYEQELEKVRKSNEYANKEIELYRKGRASQTANETVLVAGQIANGREESDVG